MMSAGRNSPLSGSKIPEDPNHVIADLSIPKQNVIKNNFQSNGLDDNNQEDEFHRMTELVPNPALILKEQFPDPSSQEDSDSLSKELVPEPPSQYQVLDLSSEEQVPDSLLKELIPDPPSQDQVPDSSSRDQVLDLSLEELNPDPPSQDQVTDTPSQDQVLDLSLEEQLPNPTLKELDPDPPSQDQVPGLPSQDQVSDPPSQDQVPGPPSQDPVPGPPSQDQVSDPPSQDQVLDLSLEEQLPDPTLKELDPDPPSQDQVPDPALKELNPDPPSQDQVPDPPSRDQVSDPPSQDRVLDLSLEEQLPDPTLKELDPDPPSQDQVPDPALKELNPDPPSQDQVSDPSSQDHVLDPSSQDRVSGPPSQDQVSDQSSQDQVLDLSLEEPDPFSQHQVSDSFSPQEKIPGPTLVEEVQNPPIQKQFRDLHKVNHVLDPPVKDQTSDPAIEKQVLDPTIEVLDPTMNKQVPDPTVEEEVQDPTMEQGPGSPVQVLDPTVKDKFPYPSIQEQTVLNLSIQEQVSDPSMQALKLDQCSSVSEQNQAVVRLDQRLQELSELQPCMSSCVEQTEEQVLRSPQQRPVFGDQQLTNDLPDLQLEEQVLQSKQRKEVPDPQVHEQNEMSVSVSDSQDHKSVSDQPSGHDCGDVGRASTCSEQDKLLSNTQQESDVGHSEQATCSEASCSEQGKNSSNSQHGRVTLESDAELLEQVSSCPKEDERSLDPEQDRISHDLEPDLDPDLDDTSRHSEDCALDETSENEDTSFENSFRFKLRETADVTIDLREPSLVMIYNSENDPAQFMKSNQCLRPQTAVRGRRRRLPGRTFGSCDGIKEKTLEIDAENSVVMEQCETLSKLQNIEPISVGKHPEDSKNLNPCEDLFSGNMQSTIIHLKIVPAIETSHNDNNKELRSSSFSGSRDLEIGKEVADVEANKLNSQCVSDLEKVRGVDENLDKAKTSNGFPSSAFAENTDLKVEAENSIKPKGNFKKSFLFDKEEAAAERKEMDSRRIALKEFEIIKQLERNLLDCKNKKRKPMKPRNPSNNNNTMQVIQTKPVEQMPVEQKPVEQKPVSQPKKCANKIGPASYKRKFLKCLGPESVKQKKLEKHGISSLETMQFLRKGWKVATIYHNSHQNYREGEQIYHSIDKPPKKEKVSLWVELNKKDDLVPIGNEELVLWNMSESEINELKSQVQTEMEHKRKEHIMPLNLQMSYDQIETAYEEVSEVMKTYDITEKDSDDEEVVEEEEADDDVEIRSFDVIIHDEMLKTVSRETVELGQTSQYWKQLENGKNMEWRRRELLGNGLLGFAPDEEPVLEERQTDYSRSRPKRLAVDYSPSAYAPIRFMEGKRLSSDRSPPKKKSRPSKKQSNATSTAKRKKVKSQEVLDSETEDTVGIKEDNIPQSIDSRRKERKNSFSGNCINKKKAKCSNAQTPIEIANGSPNSETNDSQQPVAVDHTISNVSCDVLNSESPVRLPTVLSQTPDSVTVSQSLSRTVNIGKTSIVTHVRLSVFENTDLLAPLPDLRLSNSFSTKNDSASASNVGSIPSTLMLSHSEHPC